MKHIILILCAIFITLPAFAHGEGKESTYDRVIRTGKLKCGYMTSPPVLLRDPNTGALSGMDVEVWRLIAKNLDVELEWVASAGWGAFPEDLRQGRYDAYCSQIWMTPARTKFLSTTTPIAYNFLNTYVRLDETRFEKDLSAFNAKSVSIPIVEGDITEHMSKLKFPDATYYAIPSNGGVGDMYLSVVTKKADVLFIDPARYEAASKNSPVKLKKLDIPPFFTFGGRYSFAVGEYDIRDAVNVVIQGLIDDGTVETIVKKTSPYITPPRRNYTQ